MHCISGKTSAQRVCGEIGTLCSSTERTGSRSVLKSKFFSHRECEFFPCHPTSHPENFNCLFCYCPLYPLGDACRGDFTYTANGIKDCSRCTIPHGRESYDYIAGRFSELDAIVRKMNAQCATRCSKLQNGRAETDE